jgi:hypothetical protein
MTTSPPAAVLPLFFHARQTFAGQREETGIQAAVEREVRRLEPALAGRLGPGARVAVAVGSRGISDIAGIVAALVRELAQRGCEPFLIPTMGSHGGATPEGQEAALARLGITESSTGAPVRSQGRVLEVGRTDTGLPVYCDKLAASADAILPVNRIDTRTNFNGPVESGLLKMLAVCLGKREAAEAAHRAALDRGLGRVLLDIGGKAARALTIPFGLAVVENASRRVARIAALAGEVLVEEEPGLLEEAKALKGRLPFDALDLLIVDCMGKNYSGTGMDTKVIGRMLLAGEMEPPAPRCRRIYARDLSPESGGNAHGMGLADFFSPHLAEKIDERVTAASARLSSLRIAPRCAWDCLRRHARILDRRASCASPTHVRWRDGGSPRLCAKRPSDRACGSKRVRSLCRSIPPAISPLAFDREIRKLSGPRSIVEKLFWI